MPMMNRLLQALTLGILGGYIHLSCAATPITVTLQSAPSNLPQNRTGIANYVVTLNSAVPGPLTLSYKGGVLGGTQTTVGSSPCTGGTPALCGSTFRLTPGKKCCLSFGLTPTKMSLGKNILAPLVGTIPATYQGQASPTVVMVSGEIGNTPLTTTPSSIALSVNCSSAGGRCVYSNAALTGHTREITITNTSTKKTTTPLKVTWIDGSPEGTASITTDHCSGATLPPLGTCTISITPGQVATSDCTSGNAPISPAGITVNTLSAPNAIIADVVVLSYGCIYQGGYVYSIDDTGTCTSPTPSFYCSVNGTVTALMDQASAFPNGVI